MEQARKIRSRMARTTTQLSGPQVVTPNGRFHRSPESAILFDFPNEQHVHHSGSMTRIWGLHGTHETIDKTMNLTGG
jgi:hypothetical protein